MRTNEQHGIAPALLTCLLIAPLSRPTARKTWRRARPSRWPIAAFAVLVVVASSYILLGGLSWLLGAQLVLDWPTFSSVLVWVLPEATHPRSVTRADDEP